jgi:ribosomal protein L37AE/L43A
MGIEKIDAYICTCDNCGEVYENGDYIPSMVNEFEIDNLVRNDGDWIEEAGKYYCPECYELDNDGYPTINESRTKLKSE